MVVSRFKWSLLSFLLLTSSEVLSNIHPTAVIKPSNNPQMISLNLQFRAKNKMVSSDLVMPFYQKAEFEKTVGDKNVFVELNPRRGKSADEISLEMKLFRAGGGGKPFYKKEFIAKVNQESKLTMRGMSVKVTPVLN